MKTLIRGSDVAGLDLRLQEHIDLGRTVDLIVGTESKIDGCGLRRISEELNSSASFRGSNVKQCWTREWQNAVQITFRRPPWRLICKIVLSDLPLATWLQEVVRDTGGGKILGWELAAETFPRAT